MAFGGVLGSKKDYQKLDIQKHRNFLLYIDNMMIILAKTMMVMMFSPGIAHWTVA